MVGTSSSRGNFFNLSSEDSQVQLEGTSAKTSTISSVRNSANAGAGYFILGKTRSSSVGGITVVQSGDDLGNLSFQGADGSQLVEAARITGAVDGTPGADDMPGRLVFSTTADGASVLTERMRIDSSGNVGIGTASPGAKLDVNGEVFFSTNTAGKNTHTFTTNASNDGRYLLKSDTTTKVDIQANGTSYFNGGNVGIGTSSPAYNLSVESTSGTSINIKAGTSSTARLRFGDSGDDDIGQIIYDNGGNSMRFHTNASERMRIDSSGRLTVGTTSVYSPSGGGS